MRGFHQVQNALTVAAQGCAAHRLAVFFFNQIGRLGHQGSSTLMPTPPACCAFRDLIQTRFDVDGGGKFHLHSEFFLNGR
jgi:hypothetical protein